MPDIEFDASFGDEIKKVCISQPFGTGGDQYHVTVDRFYWGAMWKRDGQWNFHGNAEAMLTAEDIQLLGERIEAANK